MFILININEFLFHIEKSDSSNEIKELKPSNEIKPPSVNLKSVKEIQIQDLHVTNRERGSHVNVISELKNVLSNLFTFTSLKIVFNLRHVLLFKYKSVLT